MSSLSKKSIPDFRNTFLVISIKFTYLLHQQSSGGHMGKEQSLDLFQRRCFRVKNTVIIMIRISSRLSKLICSFCNSLSPITFYIYAILMFSIQICGKISEARAKSLTVEAYWPQNDHNIVARHKSGKNSIWCNFDQSLLEFNDQRGRI